MATVKMTWIFDTDLIDVYVQFSQVLGIVVVESG